MTHDRQGYQNTYVEFRNKTNPWDVFIFILPVKCVLERFFAINYNKLPSVKVEFGDFFGKDFRSQLL